MSHLECEEIMKYEEFYIYLAGTKITEGNFGARTKVPIPKPAQTSSNIPASGLYFSKFTLMRSGEEIY
jgi:hypothetical protein